MLVRRGLAMLSFIGVASWSGLAGAQYFHADPTVRLTGGYIVNEVISDNPSTAPLIQNGPLVTVAPALALFYETPRVTQTLTLTSTLGLPFAKDFTFTGQPPTYNLRLHYAATIPLDPRTRLSLLAGATASPVNDFSTLQDASLTQLDTRSTDTSYTFILTGTETLSRELTADTTLTQTANLLYNFPFNVDPIRATTLTVKNSLAVSRKWTLDTLTLTGSSAVTRFGPAETSQGVTDPRTQILNTLTLNWRRQITDSLSGSLHGGIGQTITPQSTAGQVWQPTGGAQLLYNLAPAAITLTYNYAAMVDVYTATTNLTNQVSLRVVLPIATTGLSVIGSTGYLHAVPIGDIGRGLDSFTSDVALTYAPISIPKLSFSLRGLYARQVPFENPLDATTRYGLISSIAFSYPNTNAVDVALRVTPAYIPSAGFAGEVQLGQESTAPESQAPVDGPSEPSVPADPVAPPPAAP
jgi:hypothetical protein